MKENERSSSATSVLAVAEELGVAITDELELPEIFAELCVPLVGELSVVVEESSFSEALFDCAFNMEEPEAGPESSTEKTGPAYAKSSARNKKNPNPIPCSCVCLQRLIG